MKVENIIECSPWKTNCGLVFGWPLKTGSTVFNNDIVEPDEMPRNVLGISSSLAKMKITKKFKKECYFVILTSCTPQLQLSSLTKNVPF